MGEKTLEVSVDKFVELCKIDARMETLKAYIEKAEKKGGFVELDTVKLIMGVTKHESL